jgi:hypothetical protein
VNITTIMTQALGLVIVKLRQRINPPAVLHPEGFFAGFIQFLCNK